MAAIYQSTQPRIPEDFNFNQRRCENLQSRKWDLCFSFFPRNVRLFRTLSTLISLCIPPSCIIRHNYVTMLFESNTEYRSIPFFFFFLPPSVMNTVLCDRWDSHEVTTRRNVPVSWKVTACELVEIYSFGGTYSLFLIHDWKNKFFRIICKFLSDYTKSQCKIY